mmetsp:Transcript_20796/g.59419  ORF Transcript_20796/g.59419 Transcript_20796/m.59419 type:complete len:210 (-) Transcript_20796:316-945(-)
MRVLKAAETSTCMTSECLRSSRSPASAPRIPPTSVPAGLWHAKIAQEARTRRRLRACARHATSTAPGRAAGGATLRPAPRSPTRRSSAPMRIGPRWLKVPRAFRASATRALSAQRMTCSLVAPQLVQALPMWAVSAAAWGTAWASWKTQLRRLAKVPNASGRLTSQLVVPRPRPRRHGRPQRGPRPQVPKQPRRRHRPPRQQPRQRLPR